MNDKAVELILALSEEGKTDDFILRQLIYTPNIRLKKDEAVSLVAKTLKRNESDVSQSLNTLTNPADTQSAGADDAPVLEADDDNILESALAQTWDWLDNATDDTWAESTTDWFVNQARVFKQGRLEGGLGDELIGAMDGDADFEALAQAMRNIDSVGQSEAAAKFNKEMQEVAKAGGGFWDKVGVFADNISGGSEVLANSFGRMLGSGTELSGIAGGVGMGGVTAGAYAAVGAGAGSVVPGAGTAAGGLVGGAGGFVKGFMGGVSGMVDAHATIMEILKEELQMKGMKTTGENLEKIFNDEKIVSHMRSQAIARGVTIAVFDSIAAVGSGKAMGIAAKSTSKALTSTAGKSVVGMAVETPMAMVGEAAAQLASTGEIDAFEAVLEGIAEVPMSGLTVGGNLIFTPTYKIDGQSVTAIEAQQFIEGGNDVSRLDIKNDGEMSSRVSGIRKGQKRTINETKEVIKEEAQKAGVELDEAALSSATDYSLANSQRALANGDTELAAEIARKGIAHARKMQPKGVSQIDLDAQSTSSAAKVLAKSNNSTEGKVASDLESKAASNRKKAKSTVGRAERSRLASLAESQEKEAKSRRSSLLDRYKKMAQAEPRKARALQSIDTDIHNIQLELKSKNLTAESRAELEAELERKATQRKTLEDSFDPNAVSLSNVEATTDVKEQVQDQISSLEQERLSLNERLQTAVQEVAEGTRSESDVADIESEIQAVEQESQSLVEALSNYNDARSEYDSTPSDQSEAGVLEAANGLSSVLGIETEAAVLEEPATSWSAESQAENHFADEATGGVLGSTYTLDGQNQVGQPKASVSIFNERSKIVKGKMSQQEMVQILNEFKEANKDIFEGNEDVLSIGTYYDAQSDQTFIDVAAVVDKKAAVALGEQYNQISVFALDTMEEIATGGDGKVVEGLKPEIDRVADIRALTESKAEEKETSATDDLSEIDRLVEETRSESKESEAAPKSKYPDRSVQANRKNGKGTWLEGMGGLTAKEAKILNRFQALADFLGLDLVVYPDAETAGNLDGGEHGTTWGGLYSGGAIHINPSQIRENQRLEFDRGEGGLKKTKSFAETVQEEVMHAVIGKTLHSMYSKNPDAAKRFKANLESIAGRNKELLERVKLKEAQYRSESKSEAEVFEEGAIELLSAFASGDVDLGLIERVRIAINKMMIAIHGATGKDLAITNSDSMRAIIAKFAMAQEKGIVFGSDLTVDSQAFSGETRASERVSPARLAKNEDGTVTVTYNKPIYKYFGFGERKDIGSTKETKSFRDQWHFINWWKKTTDMGKKQELTGFTDSEGKIVDVDRIKGYGARKSNRLESNPIKQKSKDLNRMVSSAEAQGLISKPVAAAVRRKTAPILRMINQAESRGETNPQAFGKAPQFQERLDALYTHVEGIIEREAKAKGKEFNFKGDSEARASDSLFEFMTNLERDAFSPQHVKMLEKALRNMGVEIPKGKLANSRVATYDAMRQFLMVKFEDNPAAMQELFQGLMGQYMASPELRAAKFGDENPLEYFVNYQAEAEAKVDQALNDGVLTGSRFNNLAKMNFFAALVSAKNQSKPNMEAVLQLMVESEALKFDGASGITESLAKKVGAKKVKGASGVGVRSYAKAIRKLNSIINGDLDLKGISPTFKKIYAKEISENGPFVRSDGEVDWKRLTGFLLSPYSGANVIERTMSQALFGNKVGAWLLNMNQELMPNLSNKKSGKLSDIVTVDTHVYNTTQLVLGMYEGAEGLVLRNWLRLTRKLESMGVDMSGVNLEQLGKDVDNSSYDLQYSSLFGGSQARDAKNRADVSRAVGIMADIYRSAKQHIEFLEVEGKSESDIAALERILEQIENPTLPESNSKKRKSAEFVAQMASVLADTFPDQRVTPSTVGQLIFADRQIFVGHKDSAIFDADGNLKESLDYKTYAGALRNLPPMKSKSDARASQLLLFPTEAGKKDATQSNLYRTRGPKEALAVLRNGESISNRVVQDALNTDATSRRIIAKGVQVESGRKVGVRLNLNVMKNTGVPVQTMHDKTATGEALKYAGAVMVKNPNLNVNQNARKKIVTFQENKFPMASVDGEFMTDNIDLMNFDGVKAFFNPFKHNVFVDAAGRPIKSAEEATIVGNTVYLRGDIEYYGFNDPILKQGRSETASERAKRVKRGPKYTKAVKRFQAMAERNGVQFADALDVELAYDNMPIESKVALNESEVAANMEEAQTRASSLLKTRKTAGRMARKYPGVRGEILSNPKNYFTPQSLKELKGELGDKSDADLIAMMSGQGLGNLQSRNDDLGVLATSELINRAVGRGDMDAVPFLVEQAAAVGTTAGRLLRHLRELKSGTPAGIVGVIESAVQKRGNSLSPAQKQRLERIAADLFQRQAEHEELMKQAIAGQDVEIELEAATRRVKMAERELDTFSNGVIERGWGEIGTMLIQGNLLTPMSQITNVGANMVNALGKVAVDAIALPVERLINAFGIESPMKRNYAINAYMYGLRKFGQGFVEALDTIATGQEADVTEWRVHRGFAPFRSLMSAMGKGELPLGPDGAVSNSQRVKLAVQGTFGIPAETMFRFLTLGDTPFRRYVEGIELYQAGKAMGLEGDALTNFIKHPTKKAREAAEREGRKLTFQERTAMSDVAEDSVKFFERVISKGMSWVPGLDSNAFAKFLIRSNMPYVRTPANMLIETLTYVSPYIAGPSIVKKLAEGDARGASQDFGKIVVGTMVSQTAVTLIREGLISEALDWSDDEKRNISYDQFPPSSINVTGVQRWVKGEDPSHQPDDVFVGYNKLGILGAVIGATAKSVNREELRQRDDEEFAMHALQDVFGLGAFSGITYMMDQSFMQGMSTLIDVISASDAEDLGAGFEKWTKTTFQAISATVLPNTLSALYRGNREYLPDTRVTKDMSRGERILTQMAYTIKDRTFGLSDLPVRVDWKGNPIKQNPRGTTGIAYQIFDITKSRQGEADAVSNEIYRLYEQTEDLTKACGTPGYASKRKINVPNITSRYKRKLQQAGINYPWMQDEEFQDQAFYLNTTQLNKLMEASGKERYQELEALINTEEYAKMNDEERVRAMNKINDNYNGAIEYEGNRFRNHTLMLFQIMQEQYENERSED
jgi:hypothetical protein